ncbi:MAG: hypothetical protein VB064_13005 [Oscillospiraceae bacterium]|nr:hypothetical protein [Oscillospiraceae bacterium]
MTNESRIGLLTSKSQLYKINFVKATAKGDTEAAAKWKAGYHSIKAEISELKEA